MHDMLENEWQQYNNPHDDLNLPSLKPESLQPKWEILDQFASITWLI